MIVLPQADTGSPRKQEKILRTNKRGESSLEPPHWGVPNPHFEARTLERKMKDRKLEFNIAMNIINIAMSRNNIALNNTKKTKYVVPPNC